VDKEAIKERLRWVRDRYRLAAMDGSDAWIELAASKIAGAVSDEREWRPIETAPNDGTWIVTCRADEPDSIEAGRFSPFKWPEYVPVEGGLYARIMKPIEVWRGINNFHRATHWMPLPPPPATSPTRATAACPACRGSGIVCRSAGICDDRTTCEECGGEGVLHEVVPMAAEVDDGR